MGVFELTPGAWGPCLVMRGAWGPEAAEAFDRLDVAELELNHAKGWRGVDVSFLKDVGPRLKALRIVDLTIADVSGVKFCGELRALEVNTYCKTPLEFRGLPLLEDVRIRWRKGAESVLGLPRLRVLWLGKWPGLSVVELGPMANLTQLCLVGPGSLRSLRGVGQLSGLEMLGVYAARKLEDLDDVGSCQSLVRMEINECKKVRCLQPAATLSRCRVLHLCDGADIESLEPLGGWLGLEELLFYGSTRIVDGDLSVLCRLPRLVRVVFQNRAGYSHTQGALEKLLEAKSSSSPLKKPPPATR